MKMMKYVLIGAVLLLSSLASHADIPADQPLPTPTYGVNLGNTLEPPNGEGTWGPAATQALISSIAAEGFNAIRIPCSWDSNADPSTYQIDPTYMARVKQVVDWCLAENLYVVVNCHWDGGWMETNLTVNVDATIDAKMNSYWTQIATEFAGYDNHLLFAGGNEPSVASPAVMDTLLAYYQTFVNAVRGTGGNNTNRWLVMPSVSDPSWMDTLPTDPTPNRMMVEYHSYMPSLFAIIHTDQSWGTAMYFWGPAYHYDGNPSRNATWYEEAYIDSQMQTLADQYVSKGIPVLIGEFGAYRATFLSGTEATYNRASTVYWDKYVAESARAHGISPFFWTIQGDVFNWSTGAVVDQDVVDAVTGGAALPPPNGAPYAVTGLTATNTGTGQIDLSWNAVSGATSYNLYRAAESGHECETTPFATGITGTSYTDTGLNDGTTYYYQVVAVNASGPSGFTVEAHATTPGTNPDPAQYNFETDTQRWKASGNEIAGVETSTARSYAGNQSLAVNFTGTAGGTSTVSLDSAVVPAGATVTFRVWVPSGHKISSIVPWMQDYNWNWTQSGGSLSANAWNTFTLTVPANATAPFNNFGLRFTTSAAWTGTCYIDSISWVSPVPSAPAGLAASSLDAAVSLSWNWASSADSYTVKRSTTSGSGYATIATGVTDPNYQDTGLSTGTTYYYVVSALNTTGASANSTEAYATPGAIATPAPTGLASVPGDAQVSLSWNASDGADSYIVKRSTTSGAPYETIISNVVSTSYTDTDVSNGTIYFYVVSAVSSAVESGNSTEVTAMPVPFEFESGSQGWIGGGGIVSSVATSTTQSYAGNQSLAVNFNGSASGTASPRVGNVAVVPGTTITFHVWVPSGSNVTALQPYIQDYNNTWTSSWYGSFTANAWNTLTVTVPANAVSPLNALGVQFFTSAAWTGTCYIDSIFVESPLVSAPPGAPSGLAAVAGDAQVALSWDAVSGATDYQVKRSTTSGSGYTTIATNATASFTDSSLANGTLYLYVVSAMNAGGESSNSTEVGVRPISSDPAQLSVVVTNSQIELSWPTDHTGWNLEYKSDLTDTNDWIPVPDSDATNMLNMGTMTNGSIFYRLVYP